MNYRLEWMPAALVVGVLTLLFVPYLGLLVALAILLAAVAAGIALVAAVLASPFLAVRAVRRRSEKRAGTGEQPADAPEAFAGAVSETLPA